MSNLPDNFFSGGFYEKVRAGHAAFSGGGVDCGQHACVQTDIGADGFGVGAGEIGDGIHPRAVFQGLADLRIVGQIRAVRGNGQFHTFKMKAKSFHSVLGNIFLDIRRGKAARYIGKPDAICAVFVFINNGNICSHFIVSYVHPAILAICFATPEDKSFLGWGTVMRNGPLLNWWWKPTTLRSSHPSFFKRFITFLLFVSMRIYIRNNKEKSRDITQIYTHKYWNDCLGCS